MSISKCLFNSKLPKKESKSEVLEKGKTILIAESINSVDDLVEAGITSVEKLKKYGFDNIEKLSKVGVESTDDLAKIGINSADDLERLGMSAEDASKAWSNFKGASNCNKYNFSNEKKLDKHFDKHVIKQGEFGNITKDEYLKLANEFIDSSGKNVLSRTASNGDILKFNIETNEFSIVTKDGVIRTYHKLNPEIHGKGSNLDYWNSPDCNY